MYIYIYITPPSPQSYFSLRGSKIFVFDIFFLNKFYFPYFSRYINFANDTYCFFLDDFI